MKPAILPETAFDGYISLERKMGGFVHNYFRFFAGCTLGLASDTALTHPGYAPGDKHYGFSRVIAQPPPSRV